MRSNPVAFGILLLFTLFEPLAAQKVLIRDATSAAVIEGLKAELIPQGFKVVSTKDQSALFTLDRGMVPQQREALVRMVHVTLEFHVRFKQTPAGLEVSAWEEVVGEGDRTFEFRRRVESQAERDSIQALLESVRAKLDSRPTPPDSAVRRS